MHSFITRIFQASEIYCSFGIEQSHSFDSCLSGTQRIHRNEDVKPVAISRGEICDGRLVRSNTHLNGLGDYTIGEPYAGGAGAALSLLFGEYTKHIFINDADDSIYSFWWSLIIRVSDF